ncbi:hypothetical protein BDK51DRAFT_37998 [Blyttiomyces helicus]|uniref:Uncharacterized protein n=1 Tax=Blyttiomyces helicus TaxID=388810 RepID=A0A4P9WF93_9FUNG|nr:hypothetical protein BDK51DRAFT_37998 [Blyttiomyces helicus]|eukprot:RKO91401.1 hypothetical protein BDK51DRAFT_37998 [Blyttiomyces helicus]
MPLYLLLQRNFGSAALRRQELKVRDRQLSASPVSAESVGVDPDNISAKVDGRLLPLDPLPPLVTLLSLDSDETAVRVVERSCLTREVHRLVDIVVEDDKAYRLLRPQIYTDASIPVSTSSISTSQTLTSFSHPKRALHAINSKTIHLLHSPHAKLIVLPLHSSRHASADPMRRLGPATLPHLHILTLLSMARIGPHSIVMDPCCGTGGILTAAIDVGQCGFAIGGDVRDVYFAGRGAAPVDFCVADVGGGAWWGRSVDAIVSDLPYDNRTSIHASKSDISASPSRAILTSILHLASLSLTPGGRLSFWFRDFKPSNTEDDLLQRWILSEGQRLGLVYESSVSDDVTPFSRCLWTFAAPQSDSSSSPPKTLASHLPQASLRSPTAYLHDPSGPGSPFEHARRNRVPQLRALAETPTGARALRSLRDAKGKSPLHHAAGYGSVDAVGALLAAGLDPNDRSSRGESPLMFAARRGSVAAVRALVEAGAELDARDDSGRSVIEAACGFGHGEVVRILLDAAVGEVAGLIGPFEDGAASCLEEGRRNSDFFNLIRTCRKEGLRALLMLFYAHQACRYGHLETVQILLFHPKTHDSRTEANLWWTPHLLAPAFRAACRWGHAEIATLLLALTSPPPVSFTTKADAGTGETALHAAAFHGRDSICALLVAHLETRPLIDARDALGRRPLDVAGSDSVQNVLRGGYDDLRTSTGSELAPSGHLRIPSSQRRAALLRTRYLGSPLFGNQAPKCFSKRSHHPPPSSSDELLMRQSTHWTAIQAPEPDSPFPFQTSTTPGRVTRRPAAGTLLRYSGFLGVSSVLGSHHYATASLNSANDGENRPHGSHLPALRQSVDRRLQPPLKLRRCRSVSSDPGCLTDYVLAPTSLLHALVFAHLSARVAVKRLEMDSPSFSTTTPPVRSRLRGVAVDGPPCSAPVRRRLLERSLDRVRLARAQVVYVRSLSSDSPSTLGHTVVRHRTDHRASHILRLL